MNLLISLFKLRKVPFVSSFYKFITGVMATTVVEPHSSIDETIPEKVPGFGARHSQAILIFFCIFLGHAMRANLNVGIIAMTSEQSNPYYLVMPWSFSQQGVILSSFFWGLLVQIPAGYFSHRFGTLYPLFGGITIASFATILMPVLALNSNWIIVCLSRVVNGLAQGFIHPFINSHLRNWAPPLERSKIFAFVYGGAFIGTMVTNLVAGFLASSYGWPSIFYVTGLCGLLYAAIWLLFSSRSPATHPNISPQEKLYILASLNTVENTDDIDSVIPWYEIVTSVPFWALLIAYQGFGWGFWLLYIMTPSYLSRVLGFNILQSGLISCLPYILMWVLITVFSWVANVINNKQMLPLSMNRKMWNSVGLWGGSLALMFLPVTKTAAEAVLVLTVSMGLTAGVFSGLFLNHLDLAPNFAELLLDVCNGLANISSFLAPLLTGLIIQDETNKRDWIYAFYVAVAVMFTTNLVFVIFGSTDEQSWNTPKNDVRRTME